MQGCLSSINPHAFSLSDGLNILQLQWACLGRYLTLHHSQEMFESALRPEYPEDTPDRGLALYLYYLLSDQNKLVAETRDESDEKLMVLRPFVFAAHRVSGSTELGLRQDLDSLSIPMVGFFPV
jgi:hypothetical protein